MKKYAILSVISIILIASVLCLPILINGVFQKVEVTKISTKGYSDNIFASGSVEENEKKNVTVDLPVVTQSIVVKVGDKVNVGDLIATVDVQETKNALFDLAQLTNFIPQEYLSVAASIDLDENLISSVIPSDIKATADGVISAVNMVKGGLSLPKSALVTISSTEDMFMKMSVNEQNAERVKVGDRVVFKSGATRNHKFMGTVNKVYPTARKTLIGTSQETVVDIDVLPDEQYKNLKPGYTLSGAIIKSSEVSAQVLPYESVMQDDYGVEYVYVLDKNKAIRRDIVTGKEFENAVEVLDGLAEDEIVVLNAGDIKKNNSYIKVQVSNDV